MTETPGWAAPGSPEPQGEEANPREAAPERPAPAAASSAGRPAGELAERPADGTGDAAADGAPDAGPAATASAAPTPGGGTAGGTHPVDGQETVAGTEERAHTSDGPDDRTDATGDAEAGVGRGGAGARAEAAAGPDTASAPAQPMEEPSAPGDRPAQPSPVDGPPAAATNDAAAPAPGKPVTAVPAPRSAPPAVLPEGPAAYPPPGGASGPPPVPPPTAPSAPPGWGPAPGGIPGSGRNPAPQAGHGWAGAPQPPGAPASPWGWQQAWVPKPGVIPLRPLGVGEILDGAVSTLRTYWRTVLGVSVVVAVITNTVGGVVNWWMQRGLGDSVQQLNSGAAPDWHTVGHIYAEIFSGAAIEGVVSLLGTLLATALLTVVVSRAVLGHPVDVREAWSDARTRLLPLLGLTLLTLLLGVLVFVVAMLPGFLAALAGAPSGLSIVLVVVGLLAAGVVALWLLTALSLAPPALMLEKQGIRASLSRSVKLVRGSWWRIFGITLLAGVIVLVVSGMISMPFSIVGAMVSGGSTSILGGTGGSSAAALAVTGVGAAISTTLTLPISAGVRVLLYIDQRIRREALDIELARAAGLPGYGAPTGAGV